MIDKNMITGDTAGWDTSRTCVMDDDTFEHFHEPRVMIGEQVECGGGTVLIRRKAAINN